MLEIDSEKFAGTGNISGRGVSKILGTPAHDRLSVAVRESFQNACDAMLPGAPTVGYRLNFRYLRGSELQFLKAQTLCGGYQEDPGLSPILGISDEVVPCLEISDHRTSGLGGPAHADVVLREGESTDFVDFLRNIGSPRDKELGGGTYGYGKTSLYMASKCRSIIVYTRVHGERGSGSQRLIAARIGDPFTVRSGSGRGRYTGRHWYGQIDSSDRIGPALGKEAEAAARSLGMQKRRADDTGTTILVVDLDLDNMTLEESALHAARELLAYGWPRLVDVPGGIGRATVSVAVEDEEIELPDLETTAPWSAFVTAFRTARSHLYGAESVPESQAPEVGTTVQHRVESRRPIQYLGQLAVTRFSVMGSTADSAMVPEKLFPDGCHSVALMRPAELVVKYLPGPKLPSRYADYAGVFICAPELENIFASAEPPAHDDWLPEYLSGHDRTFVRVAMRRISDYCDQYIRNLSSGDTSGEGSPVAAQIADQLGNALLSGIDGPSTRVQPVSKAGSKSGRPKPSRKDVDVSKPVPIDYNASGQETFIIYESVVSARKSVPVTLTTMVRAVLEGGSRSTEVESGSVRQVSLWMDDSGSVIGEGPNLDLTVEGEKTVRMVVPVNGNYMISMALNAEEKNGSQ